MPEPRSDQKLFCFGLGFSGTRLALTLKAAGWRVAGTCREPARHARLVEQGIEAHLFDRDRRLAAPATILEGVTHLIDSVPPDGNGDLVLGCHAPDLAALDSIEWIGYLSTTGIYGDHGGGWVDETTPPSPLTERARRRVAAEQVWQALGRETGIAVQVFRLAGIYGPGRSALDAVRAGTARRIVKPGNLFSRIHVDDLAAVLAASMARPNAGAVYNVCDDMAAPGNEVTEYACQLLSVEPPPALPFEDAGLSPMAASFYAESRRVRNARIKQELGVALKYPDYKSGLGAIAAAESPAP